MLLFRNILLFHATGIILLHSFIPHLHHGEMTNVEHYMSHKNANDIIDYLGLAFQQGSSDNLTNYISSDQQTDTDKDLDCFQSQAEANPELQAAVLSNERLHFKTRSQISFDYLNASSNRLRGPPKA